MDVLKEIKGALDKTDLDEKLMKEAKSKVKDMAEDGIKEAKKALKSGDLDDLVKDVRKQIKK